jgi:hypothetical protein
MVACDIWVEGSNQYQVMGRRVSKMCVCVCKKQQGTLLSRLVFLDPSCH